MARPLPHTVPPEVAATFAALPPGITARLLEIRELVFAVAAATEGVGPLTEMLKWGEPAYLTEGTGSGSTIRLGRPRGSMQDCALFFNCNTTLVEGFREQFGDRLRFEKNRAILLDAAEPLPEAVLASCIRQALTYHRRR
ncbi:DUF1801 domain-containing protein [Radicibacter daui]|uniref:DUF1801 domain-containing protein n=1 Tax=Radicibacter daui TaxID=3064829 RepID=UPI004046DD45